MRYEQDASAFTHQALLPTHLDPKLWLVQCTPGSEKQLCLQLLSKCRSFSKNKNPLLIKSVVCLDHLKGYFYVEAEKESYVRAAVQKLRSIYFNKPIKLVPLAEMAAAIKPNKKAKLPLERGSWVRVKSGPYSDDLGKVIDVDLVSQKITVLLIPR